MEEKEKLKHNRALLNTILIKDKQENKKTSWQRLYFLSGMSSVWISSFLEDMPLPDFLVSKNNNNYQVIVSFAEKYRLERNQLLDDEVLNFLEVEAIKGQDQVTELIMLIIGSICDLYKDVSDKELSREFSFATPGKHSAKDLYQKFEPVFHERLGSLSINASENFNSFLEKKPLKEKVKSFFKGPKNSSCNMD